MASEANQAHHHSRSVSPLKLFDMVKNLPAASDIKRKTEARDPADTQNPEYQRVTSDGNLALNSAQDTNMSQRENDADRTADRTGGGAVFARGNTVVDD